MEYLLKGLTAGALLSSVVLVGCSSQTTRHLYLSPY